MNPRLRRWPMAVLTALDRLGNALALGDDRLCISTRIYLAREKAEQEGVPAPWWARTLGDMLERLSPGHLRRSAEFDRAVAELISIRTLSNANP